MAVPIGEFDNIFVCVRIPYFESLDLLGGDDGISYKRLDSRGAKMRDKAERAK